MGACARDNVDVVVVVMGVMYIITAVICLHLSCFFWVTL